MDLLEKTSEGSLKSIKVRRSSWERLKIHVTQNDSEMQELSGVAIDFWLGCGAPDQTEASPVAEYLTFLAGCDDTRLGIAQKAIDGWHADERKRVSQNTKRTGESIKRTG